MRSQSVFTVFAGVLGLYALVSSIVSLATGRIYAGTVWRTVTRSGQPGRFWFAVFCGFFLFAVFGCQVVQAFTGLQPIGVLTDAAHRLFHH